MDMKLCGNDTYKIESWVEHYNHGHLIRSNRKFNERAKKYVVHMSQSNHRYIARRTGSFKSAKVGFRMLDAARGTCKTTTVTSGLKLGTPMLKCLSLN